MVIGLTVGSFLNVCISRIPEDKSIIFPPSHCPKCNAKLRATDLIPLLSYMMLGGKCRSCRQKISPRYPLVEALTAIFFMASFFKAGFSPYFTVLIAFFSILTVIVFIDIEHMVIPDMLVLILMAAGYAYSFYNGNAISSIQGMCFGFVLMLSLGVASAFILKKDALGDGDIKLVAMLGVYLGVEKLVYSLAAASVLGAAIGVLLIVTGKLKRDDYIPFAPFLALGAAALIFI